MLKKLTFFLIILVMIAFYACKDQMTDSIIANRPPTTKLFLDTVVTHQQSRIQLYWTGDDPDGVVNGFYFSWDGVHWTYTSNNDSLFSLQNVPLDTLFSFRISAFDNSGNGVYDSQITQNGINYGPEPFTDLNGNGKWDIGEKFIDVGLIDPHPASLKLPIKNSAPTISWNSLSFHPDTSFSAMSFGWNASDIDGDASIEHINIAMNDTNNFVSIYGTIRTITVRCKDFNNTTNPLMDILIDGDQNNQPYDQVTGKIIKLPGLKFNSNNIFYVQSEDISGAKSPWLASSTQPGSKAGWFVKKPKGKMLIVDDYKLVDNAASFYSGMMDSLSISDKYDVYDITAQKPPYLNITFFETIKLFSYIIWYSDNDPSLSLANVTVQKYTNIPGNKIFFSMQFPQSVDLTQIQGFLPIIPDSSGLNSTLLPGRILSDTSHSGYPTLLTSASLARARSFYLSNIGVKPIYYLSDNASYPRNVLYGYLGFENTEKNIFFISAPLHKSNGIPGSVQNLLRKVLFQDFNITL